MITATPRSILARSESPRRAAFISTEPVMNRSRVLLIYERLFFRQDLSSNSHVSRVPYHPRLRPDLSRFGLKLPHYQLNRFKDKKSALPQSLRKLLQLIHCWSEARQHPTSGESIPSGPYHLPGIA